MAVPPPHALPPASVCGQLRWLKAAFLDGVLLNYAGPASTQ
jgi:hypothetical protein